MQNTYQIIYLNGPSSAGKSTLARALQDASNKRFLVIGIDKVIGMMPAKVNDWYHEKLVDGFSWKPVIDAFGDIIAYKLHIGSFGKRMVQAFQEIVITLVRLNHYVIIDDVSFGKKSVDEWKNKLQNFGVLWVGVTAPIEILELREKNRGDRKIGSARWQAQHVHAGVQYDLMIDTHAIALEDNVERILKAYELS